jgi:hypothetical protein
MLMMIAIETAKCGQDVFSCPPFPGLNFFKVKLLLRFFLNVKILMKENKRI